jgi:signal transduction histidine kinase
LKVQKTFQASLLERKLTLTFDGLASLPSIQADPDLLQKVFYHLVMNAIKYTPNGGAITASGRTVEEQTGMEEVEVVVGDTGIGIDPKDQELIFEKFYQTGEIEFHSSGKTNFKGGGPGLGLAIARGIVEAHGGRIWVESPGHNEETNPGSRFFVRLPVKGIARP